MGFPFPWGFFLSMDSPGHCLPMLQNIIKHPIGIKITHPLVLYSVYLLFPENNAHCFLWLHSGCNRCFYHLMSLCREFCKIVTAQVICQYYQIPYTPHSDLSRSAPIILSCAQEFQLQLLQLLIRAVYSFFHASPSVSSYSMLLALGI